MVNEQIRLVFSDYGQRVGDYGRVTGVGWGWPLQSDAGACSAIKHLSYWCWGLWKASGSHCQPLAHGTLARIERGHIERVILVQRKPSHCMLSDLWLV